MLSTVGTWASTEQKFESGVEVLVETFDRTIKYYLDGVPLPKAPLSPNENAVSYTSFQLEPSSSNSTLPQLSLKKVVEQMAVVELFSTDVFTPLANTMSGLSPSSRIGSHLSPFVGSFGFNGEAKVGGATRVTRPTVAVPKFRIENGSSLPVTAFLQAEAPLCIRSDAVLCKVSDEDGKTRYERGVVTFTDSSRLQFHVMLPDMLNHNGEPIQKVVSRASVLFPNEAAHNHEQRLAVAAANRDDFEKRFRTDLFLQLWDRESAAQQALHEGILKRVLQLSTRGFTSEYADVIQRELIELRRVCGAAMISATFEYMCMNPQLRAILAPLNLWFPEPRATISTSTDNTLSLGLVKRTSKVLAKQMAWAERTRRCFLHLHDLWRDKYSKLVLIDTRYGKETVPLSTFLGRARAALDASMTMIRMQYITDIDITMSADLTGHFTYVFRNREAFLDSDLCRFFKAVKVQMIVHLRELCCVSLKKISEFFALQKMEPARYNSASDDYFRICGNKPQNRAKLEVQLRLGPQHDVQVEPNLATVLQDLQNILNNLALHFCSFPQAETIIMTTLQLPMTVLTCISMEDSEFKEAQAAVASSIKAATATITAVVDLYQKNANSGLKFLAQRQKLDTLCNTVDEATAMNDKFREEVRFIRQMIQEVLWTSPDVLHVGLFVLDCTNAKSSLLSLWRGLEDQILKSVRSSTLDTCLNGIFSFEEMSKRISMQPVNAEELEELRLFSMQAKVHVEKIQSHQCLLVLGSVELLESLEYVIDAETYHAAMSLLKWPERLHEQLELCGSRFDGDASNFIRNLAEFQQEIHRLIEAFSESTNNLLQVNEMEKSDVAIGLVRTLRDDAETIKKEISVCANRQRILSIDDKDAFDEFYPVQNTFEALEQFWFAIGDSQEHIQRFYDMPIQDINVEKMIDRTQTWRRLLRSATRCVRGFPQLFAVGRKQEVAIMRFLEITPMLELVSQPGVRLPHWREISKRLGLKPGNELFPSDISVNVQRLLDEGIMAHFDEVAVIVKQACTDFEAESILEKMKSDAKRQTFVFEAMEMSCGQVVVVTNLGEMIGQLDVHVSTSQHLHAKFTLSGALGTAASEWEAMLVVMQSTMATWAALQREWLQLRPTILGEDASDEAPTFGSSIVMEFRQVDRMFLALIEEIDRPNQNLFTTITNDGLPDKLSAIQNNMTIVHDALMVLVNAKRLALPRFWLLNDEEMLSCLSAANIRSLVLHLHRMFPKLSALEVPPNRNDVVSFISSDNVVLRCEPAYPITSIPVEDWMRGLEESLRKSLRAAIETAFHEAGRLQLRQWALKNSGQLVDVALRLRYSSDIVDVLSAVGANGLQSYAKRLVRLTEEFFTLQAANLSSAERVSVTNAISFNLGCQEEVEGMMREGIHNVESLEHFPAVRTMHGEGEHIEIRFLHTSMRYGMEFFGNSSAPMITPFFFKSARTALLSHAASVRSLLCGSWGTGKTRFATDFVSYVGCYLWSFQCTPLLTLNSFSNILHAIISIGAYILLEDVELLQSTVAADLQRIVKAIDDARESGSSKAMLQLKTGAPAKLVQISPKFSVIAATSKEFEALPDSIRSIFRPIFVHPIDFTMLAKTYMSAYGFSGRYIALGDALGSVFHQFHGVLPGVFTVPVLAATIRKASNIRGGGLQVEEKIADALEDLLGETVEIHPEMVELFNERVQAFRENILPALPNTRLTKLGSLVNLQRMNSCAFNLNMSRLWDTLALNRFTIVYGPHFSGKTQIIENWVTKNIKDKDRDVIRIAPRALSSSIFYGNAQVGLKGVLSWVYQECCIPGMHIVFFEDCLLNDSDLPWALCADAENRFQLDGESCLALSQETRFVVTSTDLSSASPRIVSKFALYHQRETVPFAEYVGMLAAFRKDVLGDDVTIVTDFLVAAIPKLIQYTQHGCQWTQALQCFKLVDSWLAVCSSAFLSVNAEFGKTKVMCQLSIFALAWAIGLALDEKQRLEFCTAFRALSDDLSSVANQYDPTVELFPPGNNLLDYYASSTGWKLLFEDIPSDVWTSTNQLDGGPGRPCRFVVPSKRTLPTLQIVEMLIRNGQNVIVTGSAECGKSTVLAQAAFNPAWTTHSLSANREADPYAFQQFVMHRTQKKKEGVQGPASGKQLVLIVDDLHVTATQEMPSGANTSGMAHALGFLGSRGKVCLASGVVTLNETVFLASSVSGVWTSKLLRSSIIVRMPDPTGKSVTDTVQAIVEMSVPSRLGAITRDLAAFLLLAHERFQVLCAAVASSNRNGTVVLQEKGHFEGFAHRYEAEQALPKHVIDAAMYLQHSLFRAVDAARSVFCTKSGDANVARNIVCEVFRMYGSEWLAADFSPLCRNILEAAFETVLLNDPQTTVEDVQAAVLIDPDSLVVERLASHAKDSRSREWIRCFNDAPAVEMAPIDNIPLHSVQQISSANAGVVLQVFRTRLARLHIAQGAGGGPASGGGPSDAGASQQIIFPMTPIVETPWFLLHLPRLVSHLEHADNHLALTGTQTFGVVRLLRVASSVAGLPIYIPQFEKPFYDHSMWRSDCRSFFRYASKKGTRAALYVPNIVLEIPGVLSDIDAFLRCANYVSVFSPEELSVLLDTAKRTNQLSSSSGSSSSEKSDVLAEYTRRLQRQITFMLHFSSEQAFLTAMENFPACRSSMIRYRIGDVEDWDVNAYAALARSILLEAYDVSQEATAKDAVHSMTTEAGMVQEKEALRKDVTRTSLILAEVFERLSRSGTQILQEQMIDFARLVAKLQLKRIPETQHVWKQAASFAKIVKHLQTQMAVDNTAKREISPELNTLSFKIAEVETRMSAIQRMSDQRHAEFERLETATLTLVTGIETRKHQSKLLRNSYTQQIADATMRFQAVAADAKAIKQLCTMVVAPPRLKVLMECVFLVLGEDPRSDQGGGRMTDSWVFFRKLMENPDFCQRMLTIEVRDLEPATLRSLKVQVASLEAGKMPTVFSTVMAELVVALYDTVAKEEMAKTLLNEVAETRIEMLATVDDLEKAREDFAIINTKLEEERKLLGVARDRRTQLFTQLQACDKRLVRFNRVSHSVERFQAFMLQDHEALAYRAQNCFGDIIIAAAKITVIGSQSAVVFAASVDRIGSIFKEMKLGHSDPRAEDYHFVLQQEPDALSDTTINVTLPKQQYMSLCVLALKLFARWPLFAGVSKVFLDCLQSHFRDTCNDCMCVSASDPQLVLHVVESIRCGYGIIITDFNGAEVMRTLRPVLPLLGTMQRFMAETQDALPINIFGRNVSVHPKFYLVFTSFGLIGEDTEGMLTAVSQWLVVHRFHDPPSLKDVIQQAIARAKVSNCNGMLTTYAQKVKEYRGYHADLKRAKLNASKLLGNRADLLLEDDRAIVELSTEIARMDKCQAQHSRLKEECNVSRSSIFYRWTNLISEMTAIVEQVVQMEKKLRRTVSHAVISDLVQSAFGLNKTILEMIYPEKLNTLLEKNQTRVIILAFFQEILTTFAPGWPTRVRHIMLLPIIGIVANSNSITMEQGKPAAVAVEHIRLLEKLIEEFAMSDEKGEALAKLVAESSASKPLSQGRKPPKSMGLSDAGYLMFSSSGADVKNLFDAFARRDLEEAEYYAEMLCLRCAEGVLYVMVPQPKSIEFLTPIKIRVDPVGGIRSAQAARAPMALIFDDIAEAMSILEQSAMAQKAMLHTKHSSTDLTASTVIEDLVACSKSRLRGLQKTNWFVLVVHKSSMSNAEALHSLLSHLCAMLHVLGESSFSNSAPSASASASVGPSGAAADSPVAGGLSLLVWILLDSGLPQDILSMVQSNAVNVFVDSFTPKTHICSLISNGFVSSEEWKSEVNTDNHLVIRGCIRGLVFLHASLAHIRRVDHIRAGQLKTRPLLWFTDVDLQMLVKLMRLGFTATSRLAEAFSTLRACANLIYGSRCLSSVEELRLLAFVPLYLNLETTARRISLTETIDVSADADLDEVLELVTNADTDLCELGGDLESGQWLRQQARRKTESLMTTSSTVRGGAGGRRKSSVHSMMRYRTSINLPQTTSFRRKSSRVAKTSDVWEAETIDPMWKLELGSASAAIRKDDGSRARRADLQKMHEHALLLRAVAPAKTKEVWLRGLQYPGVFLHSWLQARICEIVFTEQTGLSVNVALVALCSKPLPTDLVLLHASLPERRIVNTLTRRKSLVQHTFASVVDTVDDDDDDVRKTTTPNPTIVLRCVPSPALSTLAIPLLQSRNLAPKPFANDDELLPMDAISAPRRVDAEGVSLSTSDTFASPRLLDTYASTTPVPLVIGASEVLVATLIVEHVRDTASVPSLLLPTAFGDNSNTNLHTTTTTATTNSNSASTLSEAIGMPDNSGSGSGSGTGGKVTFEPIAPPGGSRDGTGAAPLRRKASMVSIAAVVVAPPSPVDSPANAALQPKQEPEHRWLPTGLRYSVLIDATREM